MGRPSVTSKAVWPEPAAPPSCGRCGVVGEPEGKHVPLPPVLPQRLADRLVGDAEAHCRIAQGSTGSSSPEFLLSVGRQATRPRLLVGVTPQWPSQPALGD
jgi:hypothetical protein